MHAETMDRPPSPADIASPVIYLDGIPHDGFAAIRETEGLVWHPYDDNGFWAVTRHADVREVSRNPEVFSGRFPKTRRFLQVGFPEPGGSTKIRQSRVDPHPSTRTN